jgi:transcriptional regulator with XRE-family HTH domain
MITPKQARMARASLEWTRQQLADKSGVSLAQIANFEMEKTDSPHSRTLAKLHRTFVKEGLQFIPGGVVERQDRLSELRGQQGFWDFYDDVYETVKEKGGDIFVHNVDETLFSKWLGERTASYDERMAALNNFQQKVIIREGDTNFAAPFESTEYRWAAKGEFHASAPFYLYGEKLAMIIFDEDDVSVFIIDHPRIAKSYRTIFLSAWERASIPSR